MARALAVALLIVLIIIMLPIATASGFAFLFGAYTLGTTLAVIVGAMATGTYFTVSSMWD